MENRRPSEHARSPSLDRKGTPHTVDRRLAHSYTSVLGEHELPDRNPRLLASAMSEAERLRLRDHQYTDRLRPEDPRQIRVSSPSSVYPSESQERGVLDLRPSPSVQSEPGKRFFRLSVHRTSVWRLNIEC